MNAQQFLDKNKLVSCKQLAELLEVSSNTVTKMKSEPSRIQSLALEQLHRELEDQQAVFIEVTEWFDKTYGNSYFSAWVQHKGQHYFLPFQYGYGSHVEYVALKLLADKGVIPANKSVFELFTQYNVKVRTEKSEVKKSEMFDGTER